MSHSSTQINNHKQNNFRQETKSSCYISAFRKKKNKQKKTVKTTSLNNKIAGILSFTLWLVHLAMQAHADIH